MSNKKLDGRIKYEPSIQTKQILVGKSRFLMVDSIVRRQSGLISVLLNTGSRGVSLSPFVTASSRLSALRKYRLGKKMPVFILFIIIATGLLPLRSIGSNSTLLTTNTPYLYMQEQTGNEFPERLNIPKLGVNAAVESLGLTPDGAMDVPKGPDDVGWFNLGSRPGEQGSAVIAGHLDWNFGKKGVFDNLNKLRQGDELNIETKSGKIISFIVRESREYDSGAIVAEIFTSQNGAHLNLITCAGVWDKLKHSYTKRLVVFADIAH